MHSSVKYYMYTSSKGRVKPMKGDVVTEPRRSCGRSWGYASSMLLILSSLHMIARSYSTETASEPGGDHVTPTHPDHPASGDPVALETFVVSQCFQVPGVPTLTMGCPSESNILVLKAFYGSTPTNSSCSFETDHCVQFTQLCDHCNGQYHCTVHVSNPYLMNCLQYSRYLQVHYNCVPKSVSADICLDAGKQLSPEGSVFIHSPGYPDRNYYSHLSCTCQVSTTDRCLVIYVLDLALSGNRSCETEHLQVMTMGRGQRLYCGGSEARQQPTSQAIHTGSRTSIRFKTADQGQGRGFWLRVIGCKGGPITWVCGSVAALVTSSPASTLDPADAGDAQPIVNDVTPFSKANAGEAQPPVNDVTKANHSSRLSKPSWLKKAQTVNATVVETASKISDTKQQVVDPVVDDGKSLLRLGDFLKGSSSNRADEEGEEMPGRSAPKRQEMKALMHVMRNAKSTTVQLVTALALATACVISIIAVIVTVAMRCKQRQ